MPERLIDPGPGAWPHAPDTPATAQGGQPVCASTSGCDAFIARQPILDRAQRVIGYELLFRASDMADRFSGSPEVASARVIADALGSFGLDVMTHGRLAFINLTRSMLLDSVTSLLPPKGVVLELLEQIEADDEVLACCRDLKEKGYTLALDDFLPSAANRELIPLVDYVKVDLATVADLPAWVREVQNGRWSASTPVALVAERIETAEDFRRAAEAGMTHFQGFFLGKPATQRARRIPEARLGYLRLMHAISNPDMTLSRLEELIKPDAALCLRVLRTVNSAAFGLRTEVGSIREALVLLGLDPIQRWVKLWAMTSLAQGSHPELLLNAIVRARTCELLWTSDDVTTPSGQGFLLGMCSILDAIFDAPMENVVAQLPLDETLRAALLGDDNSARRLLDAVLAYERGNWNTWQGLAARAGLPERMFAGASTDAMTWAHDACIHGART
jgi:EAL and modified HD-GYP domain-containing signal transduction protein